MTSDPFDEAMELVCRILCDMQTIDPDETSTGLPNWQFQMADARRILQGLQALGGAAVPQTTQGALTLH